MRRDTQIGIILGVVILVVIGIFLSTRTNVYETKTPDLKLPEEIVVESEIEEIDINELIEEAKTRIAKKTTPTEEVLLSEELVEKTPVELSKDNVTLEGEWQGIETASIEPEEAFAEVITEEPKIAERVPPDIEETIAVLETKQEDVSVKVIHKVKPNDSLFKISRKYYGDETEWYKIYEANKDEMSGPNTIYIGQELLIPEITLAKKITLSMKTPSKKKQDNVISIKTTSHIVVSGDTLYHLARKYYDDPTMWYKIYEANEDTIEDKSLLVKGQTLIIPE